MYSCVLIISSIFVCIVLFIGCGMATEDYWGTVNGITDVFVHNTYSQDVVYQSLPSEKKDRSGIGIGFARFEDISVYPFDRPQTLEFRIEECKPFSLFLLISNGLKESKTFLISTILDYNQVSFTLDGKYGLLHEITVSAEIDMYLPFYLNIDGIGVHDIQLILFEDPYNTTLDIGFRSDFPGHVITRRTTVIIGEVEIPARFLKSQVKGYPIPNNVTYTPLIAFADIPSMEGTHPSLRQLYVGQAFIGKPFQFQIYVNNTDENKAAIYAIISFVNYLQVKICDSDVYLIDLGPEQEAIVDVTIKLPEVPAIYQYQSLLTFDPYKSVLQHEVLMPYVFGSSRIAITVY